MAGWAQTIIVGNVGRDPELKYTSGGQPVCDFSVAVGRSWTDKTSGEKKEKTVWYRVTCWRQLAETAGQYVRKGTQIMVVGEMEEPRPYMNNNNQPAATLDLTASNFQLLGSRGDGGGQPRENEYSGGRGDSDGGSMGDIPF